MTKAKPRKRPFPFYPYLLAIYWPVYVLSTYYYSFSLSETFSTLLMILGSTAILHLALTLLFGSLTVSAFLIGLACFFFYLTVPFLEWAIPLFQNAPSWLRLTTLGLLIAGEIGLIKFVRRLKKTRAEKGGGSSRFPLTASLNVAALVLLAMPSASIGIGQAIAPPLAPPPSAAQTQNLQRPDIVHIILDGYARQDILNTLFDYDNSPFLSGLEERGFTVAPAATTPYPQTLLVLTSIFAGETTPPGLNTIEGPETYRRRLIAQIGKGHQLTLLQQHGYEIQHSQSIYPPINRAFESFSTKLAPSTPLCCTLFQQTIFKKTLLWPFIRPSFAAYARSMTAFAFNQNPLADRGEESPPLLYIQHINAPHPPYVFNEDGTSATPLSYSLATGDMYIDSPSKRRASAKAYKKQIAYVDAQALEQIDRLIEARSRPLVIFLHGDHGSDLFLRYDSTPDNTCLKERFSPLLAVYSSDGRLAKRIREDESLLNLYRHVAASYLNEDTPPVAPVSIFAPWEKPWEHTPLTSEDLNKDCPPL